MIVILGGKNSDGQTLESTEVLSLPQSKKTPTCPGIDRYFSLKFVLQGVADLLEHGIIYTESTQFHAAAFL